MTLTRSATETVGADGQEATTARGGSAKRRRLNKLRVDNQSETADHILNVAIDAFAEHGFDAVSMRDISKLSGFTLSTIYFHFGDKRQLYLKATVRTIEEGNIGPTKALRSGLPGPQRLYAILCAIADTNLNHPKMAKLVARELLEADAEGLGLIESLVMDEGFNGLLAAIQEATGRPATMRSVAAIYSLNVGLRQYAAFGGRLQADLAPVIATAESLARHVLDILFPEVSAGLFPDDSEATRSARSR